MKFIQLVFILGYATTVFASDSPDTREITDPKSIVSSAVEGVVPISVDDLFYTRSIGAGAWSPDGKQIVFITNLTGRNNLWKVSSGGGWPVQLSQSDDRQSGAAWSPDGKWIVFQSVAPLRVRLRNSLLVFIFISGSRSATVTSLSTLVTKGVLIGSSTRHYHSSSLTLWSQIAILYRSVG